MSIAVEDWDDLPEARRRRDQRAGRAAATEVESETPTLGYVKHEGDSYGEVMETLRAPAVIAGVNALFWLVGRVFGVVELVGVAFFVSVGLFFAAYVLREWQRDRTALICLAGALPLPLTIFDLLT